MLLHPAVLILPVHEGKHSVDVSQSTNRCFPAFGQCSQILPVPKHCAPTNSRRTCGRLYKSVWPRCPAVLGVSGWFAVGLPVVFSWSPACRGGLDLSVMVVAVVVFVVGVMVIRVVMVVIFQVLQWNSSGLYRVLKVSSKVST